MISRTAIIAAVMGLSAKSPIDRVAVGRKVYELDREKAEIDSNGKLSRNAAFERDLFCESRIVGGVCRAYSPAPPSFNEKTDGHSNIWSCGPIWDFPEGVNTVYCKLKPVVPYRSVETHQKAPLSEILIHRLIDFCDDPTFGPAVYIVTNSHYGGGVEVNAFMKKESVLEDELKNGFPPMAADRMAYSKAVKWAIESALWCGKAQSIWPQLMVPYEDENTKLSDFELAEIKSFKWTGEDRGLKADTGPVRDSSCGTGSLDISRHKYRSFK